MKYTKMQACGNDYSYINCFKEYVRDPRELALKLADRNVGIGADGMILIEPSRRADVLMRMFNRSGKKGKMFGNGVICVVKYIYENQIIPAHRRRARIDTDAGLRDATFEVTDGVVESVTVDMGCAVSKGSATLWYSSTRHRTFLLLRLLRLLRAAQLIAMEWLLRQSKLLIRMRSTCLPGRPAMEKHLRAQQALQHPFPSDTLKASLIFLCLYILQEEILLSTSILKQSTASLQVLPRTSRLARSTCNNCFG